MNPRLHHQIAKSLVCASLAQGSVVLDAAAERRLRLKIDLFIVPTVSLLYLFCFIDRANLGA